MHFRFLKIPSLMSKDQNGNIICTMGDVRGEFLGQSHGTTPAAVIANEDKTQMTNRGASI